MNIKYRIVGLAKLRAAVAAAPSHAASEYAWALTAAVQQVEFNYRVFMPLGPGHFGYHARDRVTHRVELGGRSRTRGFVSTDAPQARWREFGTRAHGIAPRKARALRIGDRFVALVQHPGEKKRGTMRSALRLAKPAIRAAFANANKHILASLATKGD